VLRIDRSGLWLPLVGAEDCGVICVTEYITVHSGPRAAPRFATAKFRPPALPATTIDRQRLHERLDAGAGLRLTAVISPAGSGKTVLLSSWAAARSPSPTCWLSCDGADADPVRFWFAFLEAVRTLDPDFGTEAAEVLALDGAVSPDVTASIVNDAVRLPAGTAIVADDFHYACPAVSASMTDLVGHWPANTAQIVLSTRSDPLLRLHRLRMSGELCDLRERDMCMSASECQDVLAGFGVELDDADLATLNRSTEGWAAAVQMAAVSLRGTRDPVRAARALDMQSHAIADYFVSEVLDQQPREIATFMLETSVLSELTAGACASVTAKGDAAELLRRVERAGLFLVAVDDDRTAFRYNSLVRQLLRTELRTRDHAREETLQLRAGEWYQSVGDVRRASRHYLAARQTNRALELLRDQLATDFIREPEPLAALDLGGINTAALVSAPGELLAVAGDLLLSGDATGGGRLLDLLDQAGPPIEHESMLAARQAAARAQYHALIGQADQAVASANAARAIEHRAGVTDEWASAVSLILLRAHTWQEDFQAVEQEAAAVMSKPGLTEPVEHVLIPGVLALAHYERGHLTAASAAATEADKHARRLGYTQHFFAVDYLRVLAGLALEHRDLESADEFVEHALSIAERGRPSLEYLCLLDRADIWAARGEIRQALSVLEAARRILAGTRSELLARAVETEAVLRLMLGDLQSATDLASGLSEPRRSLLLARVALADNDYHAAGRHLQALSPGHLTPRRVMVQRVLAAAAAACRDDPRTEGVLARVLETARSEGYCHTIVTAAPQLTTYLLEQTSPARTDPLIERLVSACVDVRAVWPAMPPSGGLPAEPLTDAEMRVLKLLPTSTYLQISDALYISRNTVKTHLRSIYHKLLVTSRSEAIQRAIDLRLLLRARDWFQIHFPESLR
jgi:LuxR family transcriptional regulator, maltose regulon positive regulatory protein